MTQITGPHDAAVVEIDPNDTQAAIGKLKALGYEVYVSHKRQSCPHPTVRKFVPVTNAHHLKAEGVPPHPKGGATIVTIAHGDQTVGATAYCRDLDNFDRKLGTRIALGRALDKLSREGLS